MTALVQRVRRAAVTADGAKAGEIGAGLLVLLGVFARDTEADAELLAGKIANLRVFCDDAGKLNRSLLQTGGAVLAVSNFTLCADTKRGNRPSFSDAMRPAGARVLYDRFCRILVETGVPVQTGVFGADMRIDAELSGPVTVSLDSAFRRRGAVADPFVPGS